MHWQECRIGVLDYHHIASRHNSLNSKVADCTREITMYLYKMLNKALLTYQQLGRHSSGELIWYWVWSTVTKIQSTFIRDLQKGQQKQYISSLLHTGWVCLLANRTDGIWSSGLYIKLVATNMKSVIIAKVETGLIAHINYIHLHCWHDHFCRV